MVFAEFNTREYTQQNMSDVAKRQNKQTPEDDDDMDMEDESETKYIMDHVLLTSS